MARRYHSWRAALPDRRRVPRPRARRHRRGPARRPADHGRGDRRPSWPAAASGYGRGPRMRFEQDEVTLARRRPPRPHARLAGRHRDRQHRVDRATSGTRRCRRRRAPPTKPLTQPRPGHADLAGMQKYGFADARDVLERARRARPRRGVAAGALAKALLAELGIEVLSHVIQMGAAALEGGDAAHARRPRRASTSRRCGASTPRPRTAMIAEIEAAAKDGDSLGGIVEVLAYGVPVGLGSHVHWDRKLDGAARPGAHEHPGREGRRDRRRLRGRGPARSARPTTRSRWDADAGALPPRQRRSPAAPRAACPPASCSWRGRR